MTCTIYLILPPNVTLLDVSGPLEVLRLSKRFGANIEIKVISPSRIINTSVPLKLSGIEPLPKKLNDNYLIVVPGSVYDDKIYELPECSRIVNFIKQVKLNENKEVMSICTGAILLGLAGLLDDKECTTHHLFLEMLRKQNPKAKVLENRVLTDDTHLYTSAGIAAGIDLMLFWVGKKFGDDVALNTAMYMNVYFRRSVDDPMLSPWLKGRNHLHRTIHATQDIIANNPEKKISLKNLADKVHVSERHLSRVFKQHTGLTIHEYRTNIRHTLFEKWRKMGCSQEKAAILAGFSSVNAWRKSQITEPSLI